MPEPNKIDFVVVSYFRPQFTWECLKNLKDFTLTPHRVIVVDNGSDQVTQDVLWDAKESGLIDVLILLDKNYGLEPAKNYGLHFVQSDLYVDTDNDILVPPPEKSGDWLAQLKLLLDKDPQLAALALTPQVFIGATKAAMFKDSPEVLERDFVGGSMRLMRTDAVRAVGGWRSNPKDMNEANRGEERYICGKLKAKGYKVGYARDVECFHMFGDNPDAPWGYSAGVEHYHRAQWPIPSDTMFGSAEDWYGRYNYQV